MKFTSRRHVKTVIRHFLHSWWALAVLLVLLAITLGYIQHNIQENTASRSTQTANEQSNAQRESTFNYGVALGATLSRSNTHQRATILKQIKDAGFSEVRLNLNWVDAEPVKGKINWAANDSLMQALKKAGLGAVVLVDRAPAWARDSRCSSNQLCAPQDATEYANFVGAAAARYKSYDVHAWEIWNEENGNNFWKPQPDATAYAQLLIASYKAIKQQDPNATVLIGGMSGDAVDKLGPSMVDPRTYLTKLYAAGAKGYFDGIAYHPYYGVGLPTKASDYNGWLKLANDSTNIRGIMAAHGDSAKAIWITEFGLPTGGKGGDVTDPNIVVKTDDHMSLDAEGQVGQIIVDDLEQMSWIKNFDWYTYKDNPGGENNEGASYGLWLSNGQPKPVLQVIQKAIKKQ